jgi:DNA-binding beta-propeller fold protein YncE
LAGSGARGYSGDDDGSDALLATFRLGSYNDLLPRINSGLVIDPTGTIIYVADSWNGVVRKITLSAPVSSFTFPSRATVSRVAGTPGVFADCGDGASPLAACFNVPSGLALDGVGNLFISDSLNHRVRTLVQATSFPYCQPGYSCACGKPVACRNATGFCPNGTVAPTPVLAGYYAVADAQGNFASRRRARRGRTAPEGVRTLCPPGSYGLAWRQTNIGACASCPANTNVSVAGSGSRSA